MTEEHESLELSRFFFDTMVGGHTFANGCLSDKEHFFAPGHMHEHVTGYTGETCCTYNLLKVARHLYSLSGDASILDYYERALYNHILGQQDPETGMVAYFIPLATGTHKIYSTPYNSFWCCVGSGFESNGKMVEQVYGHDDDALYVNMIIPSMVNWTDKSLSVRQLTEFPASNTSTLDISTTTPTKATIKLRCPSWCQTLKVKVNGRNVKMSTLEKGYVSLARTWHNGDKVEIEYGMSLRREILPGDDSRFALFYGPVLLAGHLGTEGMEGSAPHSDPSLYNDYYTYDYKIPDYLKSKALNTERLELRAPLEWVAEDGTLITPFYDLHRERHVVYWNRE